MQKDAEKEKEDILVLNFKILDISRFLITLCAALAIEAMISLDDDSEVLKHENTSLSPCIY